jgi:hypothetical protein
MNHTAICIDCKFYVRENRLDEERSQEGRQREEDREENRLQEKEVKKVPAMSGYEVSTFALGSPEGVFI